MLVDEDEEKNSKVSIPKQFCIVVNLRSCAIGMRSVFRSYYAPHSKRCGSPSASLERFCTFSLQLPVRYTPYYLSNTIEFPVRCRQSSSQKIFGRKLSQNSKPTLTYWYSIHTIIYQHHHEYTWLCSRCHNSGSRA